MGPQRNGITDETRLPLSPAQCREASADRFVGFVLEVAGEVDRERLERALRTLVRRHPSLRAAVLAEDGQDVLCSGSLEVAPIGVDLLEPASDAAQAERRCADVLLTPFDLARGPLVRCALLPVVGQASWIVVGLHRLVADRYSAEVLAVELEQAYATRGSDAVAPPRASEANPERAEDLHFWTQHLGGAPPFIQLPFAKPRAARPGRSLHESVAVPVALRALAQAQGCALEVVLLGAFMTLLHRYSGDDDLVVGLPTTPREQREQRLVGRHENLLPLRADLTGDPTFIELLRRLAASLSAAREHEALRFETLLAALEPQQTDGETPVVQAGLIVGSGSPLRSFAGATARATLCGAAAPDLDLVLVVEHAADALLGELQYRSERFEPDGVRRLAASFAVLLAGIVADPTRPLSALPLLTDAERTQVLLEWNQTRAVYPADHRLHVLFSEQARKTPDRIALQLGDEQLTYRELDRRSSQLAHHLRGLGVGPDRLVGLYLERSIEMVVGLLGILRAGGAYVPLDPEYPKDRVLFMIEDAAIELLVTTGKLAADLAAPRVRPLCLDEAWPEIAKHPGTSPADEARPEHLAYVIYTSGSTGRPKGVAVEHRAICNHMLWMQSTFGFTAEDRVFHKTPMSFDASVWELYAPLFVGGRLVLARPGGHQDPQYLAQTIATSGITVVQFVPTMLRLLVDRLELRDTPLRWVFCGGEVLTTDLRARFFSAKPKLVNLYGPTEACIDATSWIDQPGRALDTVPIGRPIANVETYVLDARLAPVPVGAAGELFIGGAGLARGYVKRPELTRERFITVPLGASSPRVYRTGDRVRYATDGNLEYLGRADGQIKLRGVRIELGEIESVLIAHESVREAVVVVREDTPGDRRLVAYLSAKPGSAIAAAMELRAFLKPKLPEPMIPTAFVPLGRIPRLPSGKVDRNALPIPDPTRPALEAVVPPRDDAELQLLRLWEEALGSGIGVTDDFFAVGGDSLRAVSLLIRVGQHFGKELPLAALLRARTIGGLAALLRKPDRVDEPWPLLVPIQQGSQAPLFLVHPSGGNVLCYAELARQLGSDKTVYGIQSQGLDGTTAPSTSMADMAAQYIAAIKTVQPRGPYLLGGLSSGGMTAFEMAQQLRRSGERVALLGLFEARASSDDVGRAAAVELAGRFDDAVMAYWFLVIFSRTLGIESPARLEDFQGLDDEARIAHLLEELQAKHLIPPGTGAKQLRTILEVFKGNIRAVMHYQPQAYPDPVLLFKCEEIYPQWPGRPTPPPWGWENVCPQVRTYSIPGNHFTVFHPAYVAVAAQRFKPHLERALASLATAAGG